MAKNKLAKFAAMATYSNVIQPSLFIKPKDFDGKLPDSYPLKEEFLLKGNWRKDYFHNDNDIVIELGCGKGEYTVELAKRFPDKNFIGVDIKGSRMYTGATEATNLNLSNVAFLRTRIELISLFFAEDEVDEIWITFPDPQMKKRTKRMTSTGFLAQYAKFLKKDGHINLKTDSKFMYLYTKEVIKVNELETIMDTDDLHNNPVKDDEVNKWLTEIKTYYEKQWIARGMTIKYLNFKLNNTKTLEEPETEIELDDYRSFGREKRSALNISK
ncbi:MAG: tRNA (guanosine(46)-N7)-methyltransferase TrmB [Paludibacteraceae bacterium]|nr:tRNA (guanosine(46)-N7)-methyltransferase TrmB [Paludibacteraceae bacterium]MBO7337790.1 tRNA (guanosine(46)-N7)-methyltransferase TrmB [Paludibacteraceae bacterium]MBP5136428.1 tRNA (guanosine(46)-N7)-methyltransferase TrmB [Paludibacteraceae bacterium]MBP5742624.1 tRNA (guanosine(46)-N7)-methyltransferase TrmB [Paludibacteraceae bacterium]